MIDCPHNLSLEERLAHFKHQTDAEVLQYHGYGMGSLASLAIILSSIFIATTFRALRLRRGSRKYRVLLLNRAFGDLIGASTVTMSAILIILSPDYNRDIVSLLGCFFYSTFWGAFFSYSSLSVIKLYAVWRPFSYRRVFTFHKCIYIIVACWIIFVVCVLMCAAATVTNMEVHWLLAQLHGLRYVFTAFTCFDYTFTIVLFLVTVVVLKRYAKSTISNDGGASRSSLGGAARAGKTGFALWKLALNVGTFAVFQAPLVIWNLYLLSTIGCFSLFHYAETMKTQAFIGGTILLRIIIDFFVSFITDYQLRQLFWDWIGVLRARFCWSFRARVGSDISTVSDSQKKLATQPSAC